MALDITSEKYFPNITATSTSMTIPFSDIADLVQADVAGAASDIRVVLYRLMQAVWVKHRAIDYDDRPVMFTFNTSASVDTLNDETLQVFYLHFVTEATDVAIKAEPGEDSDSDSDSDSTP